MKHPRFLRIIAFVLAFVMVLELGATQVYATDMEYTGETEETAIIPMPEITAPEPAVEIPEVYIEGEVSELRNEYEKHYRLTDGSYMAVQYQVPVHYEDAGQWVDIDNTLEAVTMFSGDTVYQAVNGENIQAFASDLNDGTIMTMANGDHMITMSILSNSSLEEGFAENEFDGSVYTEDEAEATEQVAMTEAVTEEPVDLAAASEMPNSDNDTIVAQILTEDINETSDEEAEETENWELDDVMPDTLSSSILYEDVFPGVDLRYDTFSYNVKESIILKQQMDLDEYSYSFLLNLDGLEPELQEDGSILLLDEAYEVQYTIPAPYMWDSENVYSDSVFYELEETDDGWVLAICADENWLEDEERSYPVTIDPTFNKYASSMDFSVSAEKKTPSTSADSAVPGYLGCGYSKTYGHIEGYVRFNSLQEIPIGSTIIEAKFTPESLEQITNADCRLDVYMLPRALSSSEWNNYVVWNTRPIVADTVDAMDFIFMPKGGSPGLTPNKWDITPAVMQWYNDPSTNYGILIKPETNAAASNVHAFIRFKKNTATLTVKYRNTIGRESYYTYETQSASRAGTGYVGDFSSALTVFKTDINYTSATIPFSVSHVYNSSLAGKEISAYRENEGILSADYSKMETGNGWQLSVQESVVQKYINGENRQVYRDSDGTLHYFNWVKQSTYVDEDGLGLTLRQYADGGDKDRSYEIKDQQGNIRFFRNNMISYIADANDNRIYFLYNNEEYSASSTAWHPKSNTSSRLTKIIAINKGKTESLICKFAYDGDRLISISDYANRVTTYSYDDAGNLITVTHPDGTWVTYTYDSTTGHLIGMYDEEAKYGIEYTYVGDAVATIQEYILDENDSKVVGTKVTREKPSIQETVYRYDGNDREFGTVDDIVNRYAFDYAGRTINAVTLDTHNNRIIGVSVAAYKASSTEEPAANNRISKTGQSGQNGVNLLKNSGMEYDNGTANDPDWGSVAGEVAEYDCEISDETVRTGLYALKTTIGAADASYHTNGRVADMYQVVDLEANTTYTFSAYVNTNGISNFSNGGIYAAFLNSNNGILASGNKVTYKTVETIDGGWQRIYCTFTPTQDMANCRVAVIQENALGSVYYDDLQLEVGDVPSTVNLLQNATFNFGKSYWSGDNYSHMGNANDTHHPNVLYVNGNPTAYIRASQKIQINQVCTDQTFLLSGWGKAASAADCKTSFNWSLGESINNKHGSRYYGLIARAWYKAKNGGEHAEYFFMPFNDDYDEWQFASCVIVPDAYYQKQQMTLKYIDVYVVYDRNFNTMYVDNLSLRQEPCTTYTYNAQGNVVSAGATGSASQAVEYKSDNVRPATVWQSESEVYYYQYYEDNKYLPTYISNATSLVYTEYDYDAVGNVESTIIGKLNSEGIATNYPKLISSAKYSPDGSQLKEETNANGLTTLYEYNNRRNLFQTIDENGTSVVSVENSLNDRPYSSYINGKVSVGYSYSHGLPSRIIRGGFITGNTVKQNQFYNMTYDDFGNMTKISIGGTDNVPADTIVLASYDYGSQNGHLNSMTYGNGAGITYFYDELDRLTKETWSDGTSYQYFYNSEGALTKKVDTATGNAVNYEYDSIGRLIHSSITGLNEDTGENQTTMLTEHMYDRQNRVSEQSYQIYNTDGTFKTYSLKYSYRGSDGALTKVESSDGYIDAYSLTYDEIARLSTRTNSFFEQTYAYKTTGDTTTTQVESIGYDAGTYASDFDKFTLTYGYDDLGNIKTITGTDITGQNAIYDYDIQGQLTQATTNGVTRKYLYDTYGNIREIQDAGGNTLHSYTYGNADWKDLLTAYDGRSFLYEGQMYDADWKAAGPVKSGNPIIYFNGTEWRFSWEKGRQLASATGNGKTISYTYDMAGIRDSKTVDNITYHYDTLDGKVVRQTWTEGTTKHIFDIIYDASGQPYACVYDGNKYYYVLNQQGDVIRIVGYLGTTLCEYQYDAWGNVLAITGPYAYSIGKINPIRYRGYYYDTETGFYYLQSRYYDPSIGRFINADDFASTSQGFLGHNMFAYCGNNPISRKDDGGEFWNFVVGAIVGAAIGAVTTAVDAVKEDGWTALTSGKTWAKMGVSAACGVINGVVAASGAHLYFGGVVGSATGFVESWSHELIDNNGNMNDESWSEVATDTLAGFFGGLAGGHGAMRGNKYMAKQATRLAKHIATDGVKKAGSFYLKMTVNYSKQLIKPTLQGLAKGWVGGKFASFGLATI